jgi:long-chain acyl-CoA synthetase
MIHRQAAKYGSRPAIRYRDDKTAEWRRLSWNAFSDQIMLAAKAMAEFGVAVHDNIGLYSQNMPECLVTDFASYANRAVPVPMYATSSPAQVEYIIKDASISMLFVGEQFQYNNALIARKACPELRQIVVFDPDVKLNPDDKTSVYFKDFLRLGDNAHMETTVKVRMKEAAHSDVATIIYTSGTTGLPKGVMLHHYSFAECMRIHCERLPQISDKDVSMCFLPLTHIFEKAWSYLCLFVGAEIAINRDPKMIRQTLVEVHPTMMCNVPRFWEKVYDGVHDKIAGFPGLLRKIALNAVKTGFIRNIEYKNAGAKPPLAIEFKFRIYDLLLFSVIKKTLGLKRGKLFPVAGAPLSDEVNRFLRSVNIPIVYGYGLSETTATVSFCPQEASTLGSIGTIMPGVEVKIDPANSEILVKGKTIFAGYYKRPEETAKSFTPDGFFRTGDAGRLIGETLYFTERIKDLYKTSNGKYVAPQAVEMLISSDKYIAQIAVVGDMRKFVGALVVPDFETLSAYASTKGIEGSNDYLISRAEIIRFIESRVEERQKDLASHEKVKRIIILASPFSIETGELTDTLKLRRAVILERYGELIEAMYREG